MLVAVLLPNVEYLQPAKPIFNFFQFPLLTFEHTKKNLSFTFFFLLVASFFYWLLNTVFLVRQEQELRNGGTVDKKLSTLADLFRPPIELMHKGSFETVTSHSLDT